MEQYKILAEKEIESVKSKFTEGVSTLLGMRNQIVSLQEKIDEVDVKLKNLGGDFISKNSLTESQIDEIKKINHALLSNFINGSGFSFIGTK